MPAARRDRLSPISPMAPIVAARMTLGSGRARTTKPASASDRDDRPPATSDAEQAGATQGEGQDDGDVAPGDGRQVGHARREHGFGEVRRGPAGVADHEGWEQTSGVRRQWGGRLPQPRPQVLGTPSHDARCVRSSQGCRRAGSPRRRRHPARPRRACPVTRTPSRQRTCCQRSSAMTRIGLRTARARTPSGDLGDRQPEPHHDGVPSRQHAHGGLGRDQTLHRHDGVVVGQRRQRPSRAGGEVSGRGPRDEGNGRQGESDGTSTAKNQGGRRDAPRPALSVLSVLSVLSAWAAREPGQRPQASRAPRRHLPPPRGRWATTPAPRP